MTPGGATIAVEAGRPLRVVIVEPHGTGGMIHYAYQLADGLAREGATVALLTSSDYELATLPHVFELRATLRLWPHHDEARSAAPRDRTPPTARVGRAVRRVQRAGRLVLAWVDLTRSLSRESPDVVQFGHLRFGFEGLFLARLRRKGLVLADVCHELELRERSSGRLRGLVRTMSRHAYRQFDAIFLHGETNRADFCDAHPTLRDVTHSIPIGNEDVFRLLTADGKGQGDALRRRYGTTGNEPVALFFGNITPSKGLEDLLHAHAIVRSRLAAKLIVAGYPSKLVDVGELARLRDELGVADSVELDFRYVPGDEVEALMELATVVVLPYRSASQSAVLQVASTFGRPVVATRVGGLPEVVEDGVTGMLVPARAPEDLARAMGRLLEDPSLARTMGEAARRRAEVQHGWGTIARTMLGVYDRLVAERRAGDRSVRRRNGRRSVPRARATASRKRST